MATLNAINTLPTTIIQMSPGPGPVKASEVGAVDGAAPEAAGVGVEPEAAAVEGDGEGAPVDAVAGRVVGVLVAAGEVVGGGVGGEVDPVVGAGAAVVGGVDEPDTWTTVKPPMF